MTSPALTQQLDTLILNQTDCARALQATLEQEHECLLREDLSRLHDILEAKDFSARRLSELGRQMSHLCGNPSRMEATVTASGDTQLVARWRTLLQVAQNCQQANLINGALLAERQTRVRSLLQMVDEGHPPLVYGLHGWSGTPQRRAALATA